MKINIPDAEGNFMELRDNLRLTDILPLGEADYWWDSVPTDDEKPYIRPYKSGSTRRIYIYDIGSETWHYITLT